MDIMEAKQLVIKAGIEVVEYGLIARDSLLLRADVPMKLLLPTK